jgi:hypothetical protein
MPRQLGASLQLERGSLRESDMSLKFTAGDLTIHRLGLPPAPQAAMPSHNPAPQ